MRRCMQPEESVHAASRQPKTGHRRQAAGNPNQANRLKRCGDTAFTADFREKRQERGWL